MLIDLEVILERGVDMYSYYGRMNAWSHRVPVGDRVPLEQRIESRRAYDDDDDFSLAGCLCSLTVSAILSLRDGCRYIKGVVRHELNSKDDSKEEQVKEDQISNYWRCFASKKSQVAPDRQVG